jgi:UDP-N-acetylmuramoylalanine--D-glutamate ligase
MAMRLPGRAVETFGRGVPDAEGEWGIVPRRADGGDLWLARSGALLAPVADLALLGAHNAQNALAALALTSAVAKISRPVIAALTRFEGLPHRMQRIAEEGGVLYVDDSKATTVAAAQVALEGLGRPVVLIAGGDGKGQDFAPLAPLADRHCRAVLLIGRDAPRIREALRPAGVPVETTGTLDAAVARAVAIAQPGDAVVLSPACASLDQFENYVERGRRFAQQVRAQLDEVANHA